MRENRLYGSEGGGALTRSPYPYRPLVGTLGYDFVNRPEAKNTVTNKAAANGAEHLHLTRICCPADKAMRKFRKKRHVYSCVHPTARQAPEERYV